MTHNTEPTEVEQATKQDSPKRDEKGRLLPGNTANPNGVGGFQDHPEIRSDGRWDKDTSITYWYNKLGRMTKDERKLFEPQTYFQEAALNRLKAMVSSDEDQALRATKEVTDRTEGKPKQDIDMNLGLDENIPVIRGFVIPTLPEDFMEDDIAAQAGEDYAKRTKAKD